MTDRRSDREERDLRDDSGTVSVRSYRKEDGTDVRAHERKKPFARGKLKFSLYEEELKIKGKMDIFDKRGKKVDTSSVDERIPLSTEARNKVRELQDRI